jgi:hypothetical protein
MNGLTKFKSRPHSSKSLNAQSTHIQGKYNLVKLSWYDVDIQQKVSSMGLVGSQLCTSLVNR